MARRSPKLTVWYHDRARQALNRIWIWNADKYDLDHADEYVAFLKRSADSLATTYDEGRVVPTRPDFRFIVIKRSTRGAGHIAVYRIKPGTVEVMEFFHTAQNWEAYVDELE